jgi:hypothetical protein
MSPDRPRVLCPSPNLQDLVARFGGYDKITPEAWAQFDLEMKCWLENVRLGRAEIVDAPATPRTPGEQAAREHVSSIMGYSRRARSRRHR